MFKKTFLIALFFICTNLLFYTPRPAHAATITVTTPLDTVLNDGVCSLREAIQAANTNSAFNGCSAGSASNTDTIVLAANTTYLMSIAGNDDTNTGGDFDIADNAASPDVIFQVDNSGYATIDASNLDRAFHMINSVSVTMSNLTIQNGNTTADGGAIRVGGGALTLSNMSFLNNTASVQGGAIAMSVSSATLTISGSLFANNTATTGNGGAIFNAMGFIISNSTFSNNNAGGNGGAISVIDSGSTIKVIQNTTFVENDVTGYGGALYNTSSASILIQFTTFSDNSAARGGAIGIDTAGSLINVTNSTFSSNAATVDGRSIYAITTTATSILGNITLTNGLGTGFDIFGETNNTLISRSIINGTCTGVMVNGGNNIAYPISCGAIPVGGNPVLLPLANNGGPTETHLLGFGSAALNVYTTDCPSVDQRGISRPQISTCDVGAVEMQSGEIPTLTPTNTRTFTPSFTPSNTSTFTPSHTSTHTATLTTSNTPTQTATLTTPSLTPTNTGTGSITPLPTTLTPSATVCMIVVTAPTLISPAHRAHITDTTPSFSWSNVPGFQSYRLMVYLEDRSFEYKKRVFVNNYTLTSAEMLVPAKYLWRVRTQDAGCSTWSTWSSRNTLFID
jgi:CSLREA domain-containing protein